MFNRTLTRIICVVMIILGLSACTTQTAPVEVLDPYENVNRKTHNFNKAVDKNLLRPVAVTYSQAVPDDFELLIKNFATNLTVPGDVLNQVLQGNIEGAVNNSIKFVLNTTIGLGGIATPAAEFGIDGGQTDFGETLHVWGAEEGAYVELPLLGPSTERDTVGRIVDTLMDPVGNLVGLPEQEYVIGAKVGSTLTFRGQRPGILDSVYYDSADSYTQSKMIYTQNRRFTLGAETEGGDDDPYGDIYGDE